MGARLRLASQGATSNLKGATRMAFKLPTKFAKFESICRFCHDRIAVGDPISWARRGEKGRYMHFWCVLGLSKEGYETARRRAIEQGDVSDVSEPADLTDADIDSSRSEPAPAHAKEPTVANGGASAALHSLADALLPMLEKR